MRLDLQMSSEDGKINVNCANQSERVKDNLYNRLLAEFFSPAYNTLFEKPDAEGWQRTREEQARAIIDYIDVDTVKFCSTNDLKAGMCSTGIPEDYGYEQLLDKYEAKNRYLDSVEELKLVRGIDDRFWMLFGDKFTVYGECKQNLTVVTNPAAMVSILVLGAKNPEDPLFRDPKKVWALAARIIEMTGFGFPFTSIKEFADFVKEPNMGMESMMGGAGVSNLASGMAESGMEQSMQPVEGLELDTNILNEIITIGPLRTYRVEGAGSIIRLEKERVVNASFDKQRAIEEVTYTRKIVGVWDTKTTNQNQRDPAQGQGTWVFWREQ